jgi:hypothetical protein
MRRMVLLRWSVAAAMWLGLAAAAAAQPPGDVPLLRQYCENRQGFLRFKMVDGRVVLGSRWNSGGIQNTRSAGERKETISLRRDAGQPRLSYQRTNAQEQLSISVGDTVSICREPRGKSSLVRMEFQQSAEGVRLTLDAGERRRDYRAADLWRLLIAQPGECRRHLLPVLELLRPDWKLFEMAAEAEKNLLESARADTAPGSARWTALVAQLGDDRYAQREAADRALRAGGPTALAYLRRLDPSHLDAEQQYRVRRILDAAAARSEDDTADEIAGALFHDPAVWLALLERPDHSVRQAAAGRLAALLGGPIDIDPAAEPNTQKAKRDALRARIERK